MKNLYYSIFVFSLLFFTACNTTNSSENSPKEDTTIPSVSDTDNNPPAIVQSDSVESKSKTGAKKGDAQIAVAEGYTNKGTIEELDVAKCDYTGSEEDDGCSCLFTTGDRYKGPAVFYSNFNKHGCLNFSGEVNVVYDSEVDYDKKLKELSDSKNWITLNNDGALYFGKKLSEYGYDNEITFLTDVILASGKDITEIPITNNAEGMAIREIRDNATNAIAEAKKLKSNGFGDSVFNMAFDNRKYNILIRTRRMTNYEGEADHYDGQMVLMSNDDKTILDIKEIKGTCGC